MKDETNQLRVMDMFADISQISEEFFQRVQTLFLDPIIQAFHATTDVLRRLNFVEMIVKVYFNIVVIFIGQVVTFKY